MLKILQARLQQYVNCELPDVQAGFRKGRGTRDQIANIRWIIERASEFQKNIYFCFIDYAKEKAMAPHSSTLAWKIPWIEEPGRAVVHGVAKSWTRLSDFLSLFIFMHWRRKWQPTPVFLPGESQGQGSLVGFCLWGRTESDTTEVT